MEVSRCIMPAGRAAETIGKTAVGQILDQNYKSQVCLTGPAQTRRRLADLPQQEIVGLGDFFKLQGAHTLVVQLRKRLLKLQKGFVQHAEFTRGLQLLRLVAAPGLGKVSVAVGYVLVVNQL